MKNISDDKLEQSTELAADEILEEMESAKAQPNFKSSLKNNSFIEPEGSYLFGERDDEDKFMQFELDNEYYGIDILKVREINGMMEITGVPQTPNFVKGLINLRGKVIPVIDLRLKFNLPEIEYTSRTVILVVELESASGTVQMGIVVDTVSEVLTIPKKDIEPPPNFGVPLNSEYILGMAKTSDKVIVILDIDQILTDEDLIII